MKNKIPKIRKTISDLIMEYFRSHPKKELKHGPVVDWVEEEYLKLYGKKPRDTWRGIRRLHQEGILIKVKKGVYKYDPDLIQNKELYEFPQNIKEAIFKRDGYKCVICGRGRRCRKNDKRMIKFCEEIFDVYNKYGINSHIKRPNQE